MDTDILVMLSIAGFAVLILLIVLTYFAYQFFKRPTKVITMDPSNYPTNSTSNLTGGNPKKPPIPPPLSGFGFSFSDGSDGDSSAGFGGGQSDGGGAEI